MEPYVKGDLHVDRIQPTTKTGEFYLWNAASEKTGLVTDLRSYPTSCLPPLVTSHSATCRRPQNFSDDYQMRKPGVYDYLVLSIIVTLVFNPILGLVALYFSLAAKKSARDGNYRDAYLHARVAKWINLVAIIIWCMLLLLLASFVVNHRYFQELIEDIGDR